MNEYVNLSYATRFFHICLAAVTTLNCYSGNPRKGLAQVALLSDPQFNVFLSEAFRTPEGVQTKLDEMMDWIYKNKPEPNWYQQAREIIAGR